MSEEQGIGSLLNGGAWAAAGAILAAVGRFVYKMVRGSRRDRRDDFQRIVDRLDEELEELRKRIVRLETEHADCQKQNAALRDENARQQREIDGLRAQVEAMSGQDGKSGD